MKDRTHIPVRFRYCSDMCERCETAPNLPMDVTVRMHDKIQMKYQCRACRHVWVCWWNVERAKERSTDILEQLIHAGSMALDAQWRAQRGAPSPVKGSPTLTSQSKGGVQ
jgi:hypothetical protein